RRAEAEQRRVEQRYRALVEQLPAITYLWERGSPTLRYVSPQVETLLGYTPAEVLAASEFWLDRTHPDDREQLRQVVEGATSGAGSACEQRLLHRDGRVLWV